MSMFDKYETVGYPIDYDSGRVYQYLKDITTNLRIKAELVENTGYFDYYTIKDGETFESIAYKYYGDVEYFYLVMLSSLMFDWRDSLPLTDAELEYYITDSYANPQGTHHWIDAKTKKKTAVIDGNVGENLIPITNEEYEREANEEKRHVRLIKKTYASTLKDMLESAINK
jgi:hypothetical protein